MEVFSTATNMRMKLVAVVRACSVVIPKRAKRSSRAGKKKSQLGGDASEMNLPASSGRLAGTAATRVSAYATGWKVRCPDKI